MSDAQKLLEGDGWHIKNDSRLGYMLVVYTTGRQSITSRLPNSLAKRILGERPAQVPKDLEAALSHANSALEHGPAHHRNCEGKEWTTEEVRTEHLRTLTTAIATYQQGVFVEWFDRDSLVEAREEVARLRDWAAGLSVTHPHLVTDYILKGGSKDA